METIFVRGNKLCLEMRRVESLYFSVSAERKSSDNGGDGTPDD